MSKGKIITVIGILFAIYFAAAPYITVYQMKAAAARHDGEALSEYIEFPSVRQSLKDQLNAIFMKTAAKNEMEDNAFAVLGAAFAGSFIDKMVDAYITPAGVTQMLAGQKPKAIEEGEADNNSDSNNVYSAESDTISKPLADTPMSYESLDKFVIKIKGDTGKESKFVLRRRGIGWKLTEIIIPQDE